MHTGIEMEAPLENAIADPKPAKPSEQLWQYGRVRKSNTEMYFFRPDSSFPGRTYKKTAEGKLLYHDSDFPPGVFKPSFDVIDDSEIVLVS